MEGTLKGYDQLLNLVLDETTEFLRGAHILSLCSVALRAACDCAGCVPRCPCCRR